MNLQQAKKLVLEAIEQEAERAAAEAFSTLSKSEMESGNYKDYFSWGMLYIMLGDGVVYDDDGYVLGYCDAVFDMAMEEVDWESMLEDELKELYIEQDTNKHLNQQYHASRGI